MRIKKGNIIIALVVIIGVVILFFSYNLCKESLCVNSFEECSQGGNAILESYPRQCVTNGNTYIEDIGNRLEKDDLIRVTLPIPNQEISSPVNIQGQARGYWFFEASFPITIQDADGKELLRSYIEAKEEWMTEEFVSFDKSFEFIAPSTKTGTIILHKDNPSGLPENDDQLVIPVKFK